MAIRFKEIGDFMNDDTYWEMYERVTSGETLDEDDYKKLVQWLCERHAVDEIMDLIWHEKNGQNDG